MKIKIPKDFPVQPLKHGQHAEDRVTCGTCGLSWDDAIPTSYTPAPSARCPFEAFHIQPKRYRMVCETCGGENVLADAYAAWNVETQEWELAGDPFDKGSVCEDCDGECSIIEKLIED